MGLGDRKDRREIRPWPGESIISHHRHTVSGSHRQSGRFEQPGRIVIKAPCTFSCARPDRASVASGQSRTCCRGGLRRARASRSGRLEAVGRGDFVSTEPVQGAWISAPLRPHPRERNGIVRRSTGAPRPSVQCPVAPDLQKGKPTWPVKALCGDGEREGGAIKLGVTHVMLHARRCRSTSPRHKAAERSVSCACKIKTLQNTRPRLVLSLALLRRRGRRPTGV
jgi:hypothetical protein